LRNTNGVTGGSADYDPALPVALVLHRDGSASDFMPQLLKGAPKTRLFAPHATAGAFSTFQEFYTWGGLRYQFGTGDSITKDGEPLIGHGVEPDVVVVPKQSDLLAGRDTIFEAALAWVRQELKP
jgi:C-terminal processing protease CtpA/Prc